ncbi:type 1 fimbrial protein, partial [Helicobacter pullorum NCTC 12824]
MKTFMNLAITSSLMTLLSPCVLAQDQGDGVLTLGGQIIDSACGLA